MHTILTIFESHPYAGTRLKEGLDAVLAVSATPMDQVVYFRGPAVLALSKHHVNENKHRDYVQTFKALPLYDVEKIYVCQVSLKEYGLTKEDLTLEGAVISSMNHLSNIHLLQVY